MLDLVNVHSGAGGPIVLPNKYATPYCPYSTIGTTKLIGYKLVKFQIIVEIQVLSPNSN